MKKIFALLSANEIRKGLFLAILMVIHASIEVTGIASIVPFLSVLGNPEGISRNKYLFAVYNFLNFQNSTNFLIFLGICTFSILILSSIFRGIVFYFKCRYTNMRRYTLSTRLLTKYAYQPYSFFLGRNTSQLAKVILSEVDQVVSNGITPILDLISYSVVSIAIIILLMVVNPYIAISVAGFFVIFYCLLYFGIKNLMNDMGRKRKEAQSSLYKIISEILGGIKELKVLGNEQAYLKSFSPVALQYSRYQTNSQSFAEIPRYAVEAMGFFIAFGVILGMLHHGKNLSEILPMVGVYVFAGYRLLPAMQTIYSSATKMKYGLAAVNNVYDDFYENSAPAETLSHLNRFQDQGNKILLRKSLQFKNVSYTYPSSSKKSLDGIDFILPANSSLGIVGATGAGKSTLVDVLLGLLPNDEGQVYIDDTVLTPQNSRLWQDNIGYVPQHIFLADDTLARNIAFGVEENAIDYDKIINAARLAQIHEFIESELPEKYQTHVGERGVRLSGGQRQRIGIARALYHNPDIIVFDEATSALDVVTEADVMKAIEGLSGKKSIIMVTHRLDTIKKCDQVLALDGGKLLSIENKNTRINV